MLIVQDRKKPSPQIRAGLVQMLLCDRPQQAILHQVVGCCAIARERASIAPHPGNFCFEKSREIAH
jgi:hypothetical protein